MNVKKSARIALSRMPVLLAIPLMTALLAPGALAQSASTPMTVPEIRQCLCLQPRLQPLQDAWLAKQKDFDEHQRQLSVIDQEVAAQRAKLNPDDVVGQQVLKDLLSQQQEMRVSINTQYLPAVTQARNDYNGAVQQYNGTCTRPRYGVDETMARQNLSCLGQ
jgi:hypothetical protein